VREPPRRLVEQLEAAPSLPAGSDERFSGYGVMGLPFASGHILAMRRFPASSVGPGYTSVWHRAPTGEWVFYATVSPRQSCTRFFGNLASDSIQTEISITWSAPFRFRVTVPAASLDWEVGLGSTASTRLMSTAGRLLPRAAWQSSMVLAAMGRAAGPLLGVGRVGLVGSVPNGQRFIANPRVLWAITDSRAVLGGEDLGPPGPIRPQAQLGDFWIPQRGMFALGQSYFEPFDPARHSSRTAGSQREAP
jgi:hypothetical protein